jgi:hypothetical protein
VAVTVRHLRSRRFLVPSLIALALISSACAGNGAGSGPGPNRTGGQSALAPVRDLTSIDTLRDAFNDDAGSTRLVLLISPA